MYLWSFYTVNVFILRLNTPGAKILPPTPKIQKPISQTGFLQKNNSKIAIFSKQRKIKNFM